ncbi:MAG TPA: hypothetical protein ENN29_11820 [Candidatus Hydrogenedentes bacterium]|nr:hypothetical protein [Candidatus Hydrogenedentota bacterium]
MKSSFFYEGRHRGVAKKIKAFLNAAPEFLSAQTAGSPRAVGDAVQALIAEKFDVFLGSWCAEYSSTFARRAMADIAFRDKEKLYCVVDVKTHREDTAFNMPNLTSVERLSRFYEDDANVFAMLMIKYGTKQNRIIVTEVIFEPIEFLNWECLTIGALGWGQIQIANSNRIVIDEKYSRKQWMLELCDIMMAFYPKEISKIQERIGRFEEIKTWWSNKEDIWVQ